MVRCSVLSAHQDFGKQIIKWALKVENDSGYLVRKPFRKKMSIPGLRNDTNTCKKAGEMYQVWLK